MATHQVVAHLVAAEDKKGGERKLQPEMQEFRVGPDPLNGFGIEKLPELPGSIRASGHPPDGTQSRRREQRYQPEQGS